MNEQQPLAIYRYQEGSLTPAARPLVAEYPLALNVNGTDLATLVASPHQLNYLALGFLRLQGMISSLDDVRLIGICEKEGAARVDIEGTVPESLTPTLTSGCGTGISFNLDLPDGPRLPRPGSYQAAGVIDLMRQLSARAELYSRHGGLHSAAVGRDGKLLLHAEDLGRHNTLDRIAGEALFKKIDLAGCMLVTSGRISSEMVAKSARLDIGLLASRTSPTRAAVELAQQAGITLIGYLRGQCFEVYTHPAQLALPSADSFVPNTTGVILAGGASRRMGSDKSLLPLDGERFIERSYQLMARLFEEVIIVTNSPELYTDIPCRKVPDLHPGKGALAGIHAGLHYASQPQAFVVACDMPFLQPDLIRHLCVENHLDVHIPQTLAGPEPLHACYTKNCLPAMEEILRADGRRIIDFFPQVQVCELGEEQWRQYDPDGLSFRNINTPEDYFALRDLKQEKLPGRRSSLPPD